MNRLGNWKNSAPDKANRIDKITVVLTKGGVTGNQALRIRQPRYFSLEPMQNRRGYWVA